MRHLLVTNDFPPKTGGIQSYLWELWRRLPPGDVTVLTTPHPGAEAWDEVQPFRVVRTKQWWLLPTPGLIRRVNELATEVGAGFVVLDPALPLGLIGPRLDFPYLIVGHGAEFTIPARLPLSRWVIQHVAGNASGLIAGGAWVEQSMRLAVAGRTANVPSINIPPGVDAKRFRVAAHEERMLARERFELPPQADVVVGVSRLVPRKGFDRLIKASSNLAVDNPNLRVLIAGTGRDRDRLERLVARLGAPVTLLGRVTDEELPMLYASADLFCMPCHDRWFGLEQEGFGIVFVEAAAAGIPAVAGHSGGSGDAVVDGETGRLVTGKVGVDSLTSALGCLLADRSETALMGRRARARAVEESDYDKLAVKLADFLENVAETAGN